MTHTVLQQKSGVASRFQFQKSTTRTSQIFTDSIPAIGVEVAPSARYICRKKFREIFKLREERHRNIPLRTELCFLWMMGYKDAAPTALRMRRKERWTETGGQNKVASVKRDGNECE
jgi:hypothetical protein